MHKFDVAFSYATEDRAYVESVREHLKLSGINVFFDRDETADLAGKNLIRYLDDVFRVNAHYCVVFVSQHYVRKPWTKYELEAAQTRALADDPTEYIIIARFDDTEVPGLLSTRGHIDLRSTPPKRLADIILTKLKPKQEKNRTKTGQKRKVWLLEDQRQYIQDFQHEMRKFFDIRAFQSFSKLKRELKTGMPDVVLLDLYWATQEGIDRKPVDQAIEELNQVLEKIGDAIKKNHLSPEGVQYLRQLRAKYTANDLPVLIYTRAGQYLLDADNFLDIIKEGSSFILKKYGAVLKQRLIDQYIDDWKLENDVFISYAAPDVNLASAMKALLLGHELKVLMSEKSRPTGEPWDNRLLADIKSSKTVVLLLTANSVSNQWVMAEAGASWALRKKLFLGYKNISVFDIPSLITRNLCQSIQTDEQMSKFAEDIYSQCRPRI